MFPSEKLFKLRFWTHDLLLKIAKKANTLPIKLSITQQKICNKCTGTCGAVCMVSSQLVSSALWISNANFIFVSAICFFFIILNKIWNSESMNTDQTISWSFLKTFTAKLVSPSLRYRRVIERTFIIILFTKFACLRVCIQVCACVCVHLYEISEINVIFISVLYLTARMTDFWVFKMKVTVQCSGYLLFEMEPALVKFVLVAAIVFPSLPGAYFNCCCTWSIVNQHYNHLKITPINIWQRT